MMAGSRAAAVQRRRGFGRLPTRKDVQSNPPGVIEMLTQKKVVTVLMSPDEERKWQRQFDQLFKGR